MGETQLRIARRLRLTVSTMNLILNRRRRFDFSRRTVKKVFRAAKELGFEFSRLKHRLFRRHPRKGVMAGVEVRVTDRFMTAVRPSGVSWYAS